MKRHAALPAVAVIAAVFLFLMIRETGYSDVSIHIDGEGGEVEAMGGVSNVGVSSGCLEGSGVKKTEKREVREFNAVGIDGVFDIHIVLQKEAGVAVTGDDNILPVIITRVESGTLEIKPDTSICPKSDLTVRISTGDIQKIVSDGANTITVSGVDNDSLDLELSGTSEAEVSGSTRRLKAVLSGTGVLEAEELRAENVKITVAGAGEAVVSASRRLDASITGAGDITYHGTPSEVSKHVAGAGDIKAAY